MNFLKHSAGPKIMRSCGCSGSGQVFGTSAPVTPDANYATVCDDKYFQLGWSAALKILGVPNGGNCQNFLQALALGGGVFRSAPLWMGFDGVAFANGAPAFTLPWINAPTSGVFPSGQTFTALMASASGTDEYAWQMFHAPSAGQYMLQSDNGIFRLVDVGTLPGLDAVCSSGSQVSQVKLFGCANIGTEEDPEYVSRKLNPGSVNFRFLVASVPEDGETGFKLLPADEMARHPIGFFPDLRLQTIFEADGDGVSISGGFAVDDRVAQTDCVLLSYSPALKKLRKIAPPSYAFASELTNHSSTSTGTFALLGGGHGTITVPNVQQPKALIIGTVNLADAEAVNFALFRDGVQVHEVQFGTGKNVAFSFVDGLDGGNPIDLNTSHTWDIRIKKDGGSDTGFEVRYSSLAVTSLLS